MNRRTLLPLALLALLVTVPDASTAQGSSPGPEPSPGAASEASREAAFRFAEARMAAAAGDFRDALSAFERAVELAPDEPYLRLEYGRFLTRLGHFSRDVERRSERFVLAAEQLAAARNLVGLEASSGEGVEVLREAGLLYLDLTDGVPEALPAAKEILEAVRRERPDDPEILIPLGQIYRGEGQAVEAVDALRRAVASVPGNGWAASLLERALIELVRQRLQDGEAAEAETLLVELLAVSPANPEARATLAELQSQRGAHAAAAETLRAASDERPELRQRLVWELYRAGALEEAARLAEELVPDEEGSVRTLQLLLVAAQGRIDEAADRLADLIREDAENTGLAVGLSRELTQNDRREEAEGLLTGLMDRLGAEDPASARDLRVELAQVQAGEGRWEDVVVVLEPLRDAEGPTTGLGWRLLLSEALLNLERSEEVLEVLPETGHEDVSPLVAMRAEALFRLGREAEARVLVESLATSEDQQAVMQGARVLLRVERDAEAVVLLERAVALDEEGAVDERYLLGATYERVGRRQEAETIFRQLLAVDPEFAPALNHLGYMWAERGENLREALELVRRAVSLDPENGAYVDSLGWAHFQLGEYEEARNHLERAAQLLPEDPVIFEHLGDLYVALGQPTRAEEQYRRSLDLGEDNAEEVRRKLESLGTGAAPPSAEPE